MSNKRLKHKFYDKPFTGIPLEILKSPAYIALGFSARSLYVELRMRMNGHNNGNINAALSELRHRGFNSPATLAKCLRQLEATKLISKTRETIGVVNGSTICNLYCLTDIDVLEIPKLNISASKATHLYREIKTLREARQLVEKASPPKKKTSLQSLNRITAKVVTISSKNDTETELNLKRTYS
jgi:hypothetical protein